MKGFRIAALVWALVFPAVPLAAQDVSTPAQEIQPPERRAFVVGIPVYDRYPPINLARNDVRAISAALAQLDFKVTQAVTPPEQPEGRLDRTSLLNQLSAFAATVAPGDTVVVYFAGHGIERNGVNYLVPSSFEFVAGDLGFQAIPLDHFMQTIQDTRARLMILVLDACRSDALPKVPTGGRLSEGELRAAVLASVTAPPVLVARSENEEARAASGPADPAEPLVAGLSEIPGSNRLMIAYAAAPRRTAFGRYENEPETTPSFYTRSLARWIVEEDLTFDRVLDEVAEEVFQNTDQNQRPWNSESGFPGQLLFNPSAESRSQIEKRWRLASQVTGPGAADALCIFLKTYPENPFRNRAISRLIALSPQTAERC